MNKVLLRLPLIICLCLGLVIGLIWGKAIVRDQTDLKQEMDKVTTRQFNMLDALIYAARADGPITPNKYAAIMNLFQRVGYSELVLSRIKHALDTLSDQPMDIHAIIQQYKSVSNKQQCSLLFQCLLFVDSADGQLSPEDKNVLQVIYNELGLGQ